jgi:hypothetical protein
MRPFILSYFDNIYDTRQGWLPYTEAMQAGIYKMLISLLEEYDHVIVFLKPKRRWTHKVVAAKMPEIGEFVNRGRIEIFYGDNDRTKAVPADIAIASDLVVGLGISTAAAEAYFAGCLAFHADLTPMPNNEFGNRGLGKIVFRDIPSLRKAIVDVIEKSGYMSKEMYNRLKNDKNVMFV